MKTDSFRDSRVVRRELPLRWRLEAAASALPRMRPLVNALQGQRKKLLMVIERRRRQSSPRELGNFASTTYSQNGEDGILAEIFRRIDTTNRRFVEFGVQNGEQCCSRLLLEQGWQGVWLEGSQEWATSARNRFGHLGVDVRNAFLTRENIVDWFRKCDVPEVPDLVSIDIDGCDWWMWEAIGQHYRPRVVVVEYNASAGPNLDWTMPYVPDHKFDETVYFGASLKAFVRLGLLFGYELVGCDPQGINAFFVRRELVDDQFEQPADPLQHYIAPHYGVAYGYPVLPQ